MKKILETYAGEEVTKALRLHEYILRRLCREKKSYVLNLAANSNLEKMILVCFQQDQNNCIEKM